MQEALFEAQPWGVGPMPLSRFSEEEQQAIAEAVALPSPPPKWLNLGMAQIVSRAWYEWHWQRGLDPDKIREPIPAAVRRSVIARDGYICGLCGGDVDPTDVHIDHIMPVARGGGNERGNLQVAHSFCNMSKGAKVID